ncbi:hypothetical protein LTR97_002684 [Elasticomyces elasticus]|uniref:Uncharacterized protein n=1 Tax=Elasticomyces elasticus TaxID=574655 RepID=A0AAN8A5L6_9PEZI|nr:hypothetical protein LTR97_002684 [Elasticomyces elasticus]
MSATPKKPGNGLPPRRPSTNPTPTASTPPISRSPSRMAPAASTATGTATPVTRTRSVRKAATRKPQDAAGDEDAKAETQSRLDELAERLQQAEDALQESRKVAGALQMKLDDALKEQGVLEETAHENAERVEELESERKEALRKKREFEGIYEAERVAAMKEREEASRREEEFMARLRGREEGEDGGGGGARGSGHLGRPMSISRNSSFNRNSSTASPTPDNGGAGFAPPSSLQRSDSRSNSKLVNQKDKIIQELRIELAEAQIKLVEVENAGIQQLQADLMATKLQNARLMEENESFQLLLSEKTLNGELADLLRPSSVAGSRPPSRHPAASTSLADELGCETDSVDGFGGDEGARGVRLQAEVNSMREQNKALTLYINNIISRLLQHDAFEAILDKTPDLMAGPGAASMRAQQTTPVVEKALPPPPPTLEKDVEGEEAKVQGQGEVEGEFMAPPPQGFLQRAKSVMGGGRAGRGGRPLSYAVSSADQEKLQQQLRNSGTEDVAKTGGNLTENPQTAPRIPLNRSNSSRGSSHHRRANSEFPTVGAVGAFGSMLRHPSPASGQGHGHGHGTLSPGLASPPGMGVGRNAGFFAQPQPLQGGRVVSGTHVPRISESGEGKENNAPTGPGSVLQDGFRQRDSKLQSHRSSVISNPGGLDPAEYTSLDADGPASPPRSTTSSGERDRDVRSGGAVMMGSKPRPLRLVQEAQGQDEVARKQANRGSWFGWMGKGGPPPAGGGRGVSGEGGGAS